MKAPVHYGWNRAAADGDNEVHSTNAMLLRPGTAPTTPLAPAPTRRGSSLVMALVLVSGAALISVLTLQRGLAQWQNQSASSAQKMAFYFAEAGISESIDDLRSGGSGNVGTRDTPALFGDGAFWVETLTDSHDCVHITSTGLHGTTAYRLTQTLQKPALPLAAHGFFGASDVVLGDGVTVASLEIDEDEDGGVLGGVGDAVDGLLGGGRTRIALPATLPPPEFAQPLLGSNGSIELGLATLVDGSALPGPGSVVNSLLGALVGGSSVPDMETRRLYEISMPVVDTVATIAMAPQQQLTLESGTHEYESIAISSRGTLTIEGPASVCVEDLRVPQLGTLKLDTSDGPVHVYVGDFLWIAPASRVTNTSGNAADAIFLVDGRGQRDRDGDDPEDLEGAVLWETAQPMIGALYAPYAEVELPANATWTGCIAALGLSVGDDATLTYDPRVLDVEIEAKKFHKLSWRVVEIPQEDRRRIAKDLVRTARNAGRTPLPAANARIPATNTFRFSTPDGEEFTYVGEALGDITRSAVDSVLPPLIEAGLVPPFAEYEDDEEDDDAPVVARFTRAYDAMLDNIGNSGPENAQDRWETALETGNIPAATAQALNVDGVLVEPFRSALASPSLRAEMQANAAGCWLPPTSKRLLASALALFP